MPEKDYKFLEKVKKRFKAAVQYAQKFHEDAIDDIKFIGGKQWDENTLRKRENRPTVTINQLDKYENQVVNDQLSNMGRIKTRPSEDGDKATSDIISGLFRHIQYSTNSDTNDAINYGFRSTVRGGFGYFRISTKYESRSFNQEIIYEKIGDQFSVFYPECERSDCVDADHCFVIMEMTKEEFKEKWPKVDISTWENESVGGPTKQMWIGDKKILVAEYWEKEEVEKTIYQVQLPDNIIEEGVTTTPIMPNQELEIPEAVLEQETIARQPGEVIVVDEEELAELPEGYEILQERKSKEPKITCYKLTSKAVLEKNAYKGIYIPIIPIYSKELDIEGNRHYISLVRYAKDPQKVYNYWKSVETEILQKIPKVPFIGVEGQFEGHEAEWANINLEDRGYIEYNPVSIGGQPVPPPQRPDTSIVPAGVLTATRESGQEIRDTIGMYEASLGERGNEISGRAILARQREGDVATFHFKSGLDRALRHAGLVILDLIPHYYDTKRTIRILGDDMEEKVVQINTRYIDEDGQERLYDLTTGKYDVYIDTGPDYATKRLETAENLLEFTKVMPSAQAVLGDLIAKNLDFNDSEVMAERLRATIPPEILQRVEMEKNKEQMGPEAIAQQQMAQMQQQMVQMQQMTEQLAKENQRLQQELQQKDYAAEIQKAQIAAQADIDVANIRSQGEIQEERIRNQRYNNTMVR